MNDKLNTAYAIVRYRLFPPVIRSNNSRIWWPESLISQTDRVLYSIGALIVYFTGIIVLLNFSDLSIQTMPFVLLYTSILCVGCTLALTSTMLFLLYCAIYDLHRSKFFAKHWALFQDWRLRCGQGNN